MISAVILLAGVVAAAPADRDKPGPDVRCGSFCLFVALRALDKGPATHAELEEDLGLPGLGGYSMRQLQEAAERFGVQTVAVETSLENLRHRRRGESFACLTLIDSDHYVLLKDLEETQVSLIDPPRSFQLGVDTFRDVWTGKALLLGPRPLRSEESVKWGRIAREWLLPGLGLAAVLLGAVAIAWMAVARRRRAGLGTLAARPLLCWLVPALAILGGCDGASRTEEPAAPAQSWLMISEERKDLGTILKGEETRQERVEITLSNQGPGPLEIQEVETSCTCTQATVRPRTIPAGGTAALSAVVRIGDAGDADGARISLTSNDPVEPRREVSIFWKVRTPLHSSVSSVNLPQLAPGDGLERSLPLYLEGISLCPSCVVESRAATSAMKVEATVNDETRGASHAQAGAPKEVEIGRLDVTLPPQDDERHHSELARVEIVCGGERLAAMKLPITWVVASAIQTSPDRLFVGETEPGARIQKTLVLQSRDGVPFRILGAAADDLEFRELSEEISEADIVQRLELDFDAPKAIGPWRTIARLQTDHERVGAVAVPISGVITSEAPAP